MPEKYKTYEVDKSYFNYIKLVRQGIGARIANPRLLEKKSLYDINILIMKKVILYFLIALSLLLNSCCTEPSCPELSADDLSWFPYRNYDTLIFKNSLNDSIMYFPFINFRSGSNLYTPLDGDECNKYCISSMNVYSDIFFNKSENFSSAFIINRTEDKLYVVFSPSDASVVSMFAEHRFFDLRYANKLENLNINNVLIENVYHYICYPEQETVAETYVKKGMGLVKIVFRNGQEFELVEHRKAE